MLTLYQFPKSSASYRLRIALNLKGLDFRSVEVDLREGEQSAEDYLAVNPHGLVPALAFDEADGGPVFAQSLATIEYLDERYPEPPLLPADAEGRARVRALANLIACEIHPLNNLRVLNHLRHDLGFDGDAVTTWYRHWIAAGFEALERSLTSTAPEGATCYGSSVTLADVFLVPQVANARRYDCDLSRFPRIVAVDAHLRGLPAFAKAVA